MPSYRDAQPPGLEITADLSTWETQHKCPRCLCEIYAGEKDGFRIEACGRCGGVWVTGEEGKRALATGSHAAEDLAAKVESVTGAVVLDDTTRLPCPECSADMVKSRLGPSVIDSCVEHGTWFDRHELAAAMKTLRGEPQTMDAGADSRTIDAMRAPLATEMHEMQATMSFVFESLFKCATTPSHKRRHVRF